MRGGYFDTFVGKVIVHEGGARFTKNAADPGGATKWGISLSYAKYQGTRFDVDGDGDVDADDIRVLTGETAILAYYEDFWVPVSGTLLHPALAYSTFDMAVNQGVRAASRTLQRAVGATADGIIGPATIKASRPLQSPRDALAAFTWRRCKKYAETRNFAIFGAGWMRRAIEVNAYAATLL